MTAALGVPIADRLALFEQFVDPLPILLTPSHPSGLEFEISCKFGDDRVDPRTGLPTGHGGVDRMLRRKLLERVLGKLKGRRVRKPDYLAKWWCASKGTPGGFEVPILASAAGEVVIAGWGKNKHGAPIVELAIDHGDLPGVGPIRFEHVHCARLLVKPKQMVMRGQAVAIVGHTGTDITHDHNEVWADAGPRGDHDGRPERGEKVNPAPLLARMKQATYTVDLERPDFDPARLSLPFAS